MNRNFTDYEPDPLFDAVDRFMEKFTPWFLVFAVGYVTAHVIWWGLK
jgi:hypothetical protein